MVIGKMLGHSQPATTARYAHLGDDPVKAASDAVGRHIAAAMEGVSGEIIGLRNLRQLPNLLGKMRARQSALCARKRTFVGPLSMSAKCHERTWACMPPY